MLFHVSVLQLDLRAEDQPTYIFAVHAPKGTPTHVIKQACVDQHNATIREETVPDPEDFWDGQFNDPTCVWVIESVEPIRLSTTKVAQLRGKH